LESSCNIIIIEVPLDPTVAKHFPIKPFIVVLEVDDRESISWKCVSKATLLEVI
jgi:hypothetical protein